MGKVHYCIYEEERGSRAGRYDGACVCEWRKGRQAFCERDRMTAVVQGPEITVFWDRGKR